jgi:hypothetical protein
LRSEGTTPPTTTSAAVYYSWLMPSCVGARFYTYGMRHRCSAAIAIVTLMTAQVVSAQTRMQPTAPGSHGDPVWQGVLRFADGRTFVTDGGLAIDVTFAKPATLPSRELPTRLLEQYFNASHKDEYGFGDLTAALSGRTYSAPNGIALNATYVSYLRRILSGSARFRTTGDLQPVVIVADGKAVGVLMPVKK